MNKDDFVPWDFGGEKYFNLAWPAGQEKEARIAQEFTQAVLGSDFVPHGIRHVVAFQLVTDKVAIYRTIENILMYPEWLEEHVKWCFSVPHDSEVLNRPPPFVIESWAKMTGLNGDH